jgi:pimeloyl-ACP methyl ester carboxylesterase
VNFVDANGVRFGYLEAGRGPLVLFVHGFPDTARTWSRVLPAVAGAGYRAVAPNQRGYFPTSVPADDRYTIETLGQDVIALIDALGEKDAVVIGHDWGAAAAYAAATLAPERVRLLVTLAIPHPRGLRPTPRLAWTLRHVWTLSRKRAAAKLAKRDFAYVDALVRRWSPAWRDMPADEFAEVKEMFRAHPESLAAACAYYRDAGLQRVPPPLHQPIVVPTVSFAGMHDLIAPRAFEKARRCYEASYEVVQVPGGHFMHREHPGEFADALVHVLADHAERNAARARVS